MQFWNKKNSYHIDSEKNIRNSMAIQHDPIYPMKDLRAVKVRTVFLFSSHESMFLDAEQFTFVLVSKKLNNSFSKLPSYSETVSKNPSLNINRSNPCSYSLSF